MKKLLLASAASALVATASANAMHDLNPYIGAEGAWVKANEVKPSPALKLKSDNSAMFGLIVGSEMDAYKVELAYNYYTDPKFNKKRTINSVKQKDSLKLKDAHSLMLRGNLMLPVMDTFCAYVEAGIGASMLEHNYKIEKDHTATKNFKSKKQYNFAYNLGAGVAAHLADKVTLNLGYRFTDLGKTASKEKYNGTVLNFKRNAVQMHSVVAGVRFTM